jgi:hypothetical protein
MRCRSRNVSMLLAATPSAAFPEPDPFHHLGVGSGVAARVGDRVLGRRAAVVDDARVVAARSRAPGIRGALEPRCGPCPAIGPSLL